MNRHRHVTIIYHKTNNKYIIKNKIKKEHLTNYLKHSFRIYEQTFKFNTIQVLN